MLRPGLTGDIQEVVVSSCHKMFTLLAGPACENHWRPWGGQLVGCEINFMVENHRGKQAWAKEFLKSFLSSLASMPISGSHLSTYCHLVARLTRRGAALVVIMRIAF